MTEINNYSTTFVPDDDPPAPRTAQEVEELKRQWIKDACWDIENTEGFEYHYMELRHWREALEEEWRQREEQRVNARADHLGFSYTQMKFIEALEHQIRDLQKQCATLRDSIENGY